MTNQQQNVLMVMTAVAMFFGLVNAITGNSVDFQILMMLAVIAMALIFGEKAKP